MAPCWRPLATLGTLAERSTEREILDEDELDPGDLRENLRELAMLNRLPGGADASVGAVQRLLNRSGERTGGRVLDAGTGRADIPLAFAREGWRVLAVDNRPEVLEVAHRTVRGQPAVSLLKADARALPLSDASVDVAHASLLLHHLSPADAVAVLRELRRVSRRGVVVNDLQRGPAAYLLTWAITMALTRNRYTRHDGPASARRAYTLGELDELLAAAGLRRIWRSSPLLPRVATAAVAG